MSNDRYDASPLPPAPPASASGKGCLKIGLIGCGVLLVLGILAVAAVAFWFNRNRGDLEAGGRAGAREGARFGLVRDEAACFEEGKRRASSSTTIQASLAVTVFVRTCLEYGKPTAGFCDNVPPITALRRSAAWQQERCSGAAGCRNVAQMVQAYCAEGRPKRTAADTLLMDAADSADGGVPRDSGNGTMAEDTGGSF
jgi:hypothetical protein